jgi:hypothetical protein
MQGGKDHAEGRSSGTKKPYDLTEEGSKRGRDEEATNVARNVESDDANEETNLGYVPGPEGDVHGENRVATSLSDD